MRITVSNSQVERVIKIDLLQMGSQIENSYREQLRSAPVGIYRRDRLEPITGFAKVDDTTILTEKLYTLPDNCESMKEKQLIRTKAEFDANTLPVRNEHGKILIPQFMLVDKKRNSYLSSDPRLPTRGIKIINAIFRNYLDRFMEWKLHTSDIVCVLYNYFDLDEAREDPCLINGHELYKVIHEIEIQLMDNLGDWIGDNRWSIFVTRLDATTLTIEDHGDYRKHWFMERYDRGEIKL
jgi:hypothetical protein